MDAHEIDLSIISTNVQKLYKLLDQVNDKFTLKIKTNESYAISFSEPIYVDTITIRSKFEDSYKLKIKAIKYANTEALEKTASKNDSTDDGKICEYPIGAVIQDIEIFDNKPFWSFSTIRISGIAIKGNYLRELDAKLIRQTELITQTQNRSAEIEAAAADIANREANLTQREAALQKEKAALDARTPQLQASINTLTTNESQLKARVAALQAQEASDEAKLQEQKDKNEKLKAEHNDLTSRISSQKAYIEGIQTEVNTKESELRGLKKNLSMYSNEYKSYYAQSNTYIRIYSGLFLIPLVIIGTILVMMLKGAVDLTVIYKSEPNLNIMNIVLTRLPFVTVSIFILEVSYLLAKALIYKIFEIQNQKMVLSKLSILAHDMVDISSVGTKLTDEQIIETNLYLRMSLLRSYLENEVGKSYEYPVKDKTLFEKIKAILPSPKLPMP